MRLAQLLNEYELLSVSNSSSPRLVEYVCPKCNFFNPSRRKLRMGVSSIRPMTSPEMALLQAQAKPLPASRDPSPSPPNHRSPHPDSHQHQHHGNAHEGAHQGPGLADGNSPEPVSELVLAGAPINHDEHSENDDVEFVNNWQSEGEERDGQGQATDSNVETDEAEGYSVGPDSESESAPKTKKSSTSSKAKSGGRKKATKRS